MNDFCVDSAARRCDRRTNLRRDNLVIIQRVVEHGRVRYIPNVSVLSKHKVLSVHADDGRVHVRSMGKNALQRDRIERVGRVRVLRHKVLGPVFRDRLGNGAVEKMTIPIYTYVKTCNERYDGSSILGRSKRTRVAR